jgi:hypothetical protein
MDYCYTSYWIIQSIFKDGDCSTLDQRIENKKEGYSYQDSPRDTEVEQDISRCIILLLIIKQGLWASYSIS